MRTITERLEGFVANHPELVQPRVYGPEDYAVNQIVHGPEDYAVNQIVRGAVCGVFMILARGNVAGCPGVYLKTVDPDDLSRTAPGQIFLEYDRIRPYYE